MQNLFPSEVEVDSWTVLSCLVNTESVWIGFGFGLLTYQTASATEEITANATSMKRRGFSEIKLIDRGKTGWIVG